MKVEKTDVPPKFNLLNPDGIRAQGHAEDVSHVLLNDGNWYQIQPGSFHFYQVAATSNAGKGGVPYVTFVTQLAVYDGSQGVLVDHVVEVFPASVCGIAYVKQATEAVASELAPVKFDG